MKRYVLSIAILLSSICTLLGQETKKELPLHPQVGAEWYFSKTYGPCGSPHKYGVTRVKILKDTTIAKYPLQKVLVESYRNSKKGGAEDPYIEYWYNKGKKSYKFSQTKEGESKLFLRYDLGAVVGDTLRTIEKFGVRTDIIVKKTGVLEFNGKELITQDLSISQRRIKDIGSESCSSYETMVYFIQYVGITKFDIINSQVNDNILINTCPPVNSQSIIYFADEKINIASNNFDSFENTARFEQAKDQRRFYLLTDPIWYYDSLDGKGYVKSYTTYPENREYYFRGESLELFSESSFSNENKKLKLRQGVFGEVFYPSYRQFLLYDLGADPYEEVDRYQNDSEGLLLTVTCTSKEEKSFTSSEGTIELGEQEYEIKLDLIRIGRPCLYKWKVKVRQGIGVYETTISEEDKTYILQEVKDKTFLDIIGHYMRRLRCFTSKEYLYKAKDDIECYPKSAIGEVVPQSTIKLQCVGRKLVWQNQSDVFAQYIFLYDTAGNRLGTFDLTAEDRQIELRIPQGVYLYQLIDNIGAKEEGKILLDK